MGWQDKANAPDVSPGGLALGKDQDNGAARNKKRYYTATLLKALDTVAASGFVIFIWRGYSDMQSYPQAQVATNNDITSSSTGVVSGSPLRRLRLRSVRCF
ncbi:hypothetical protein PM082_022957 [Marasmius tenuissimus]|nr:hypothetical protein PM082_022957 [Marasmius tenuissimus]